MATKDNRIQRKARIRGKISGTAARPRLSVFRSAKHIYAQVINDDTGATLASASTLTKGSDVSGNKTEKAKAVGSVVAGLCKEKGIETVVFDRNGFLFHGRIKALADSAREAGLKF